MFQQPHTKTRFKLIIAGGGGQTAVEADALNIGALESEMGVKEIRNGSTVFTARNAEAAKTTGRLRVDFHVGNPGWDSVVKWWDQVNDLSKPLEKRSIDLIILDDEEKEVQKLKLEKAWPVRFGILGASKEAESAPIVEFIEFISEKFSVAAKGNEVPPGRKPPANGPLIDEVSFFKEGKLQLGEVNVGGVGQGAFQGSRNSVLGGVAMGNPIASIGAAAVGGLAQAVGKSILGGNSNAGPAGNFAPPSTPVATPNGDSPRPASGQSPQGETASGEPPSQNTASGPDSNHGNPGGPPPDRRPEVNQMQDGLGAGPAVVAGTAGVAAIASRVDRSDLPNQDLSQKESAKISSPDVSPSATPEANGMNSLGPTMADTDHSAGPSSTATAQTPNPKKALAENSSVGAGDAITAASAMAMAGAALRGLSGSANDRTISSEKKSPPPQTTAGKRSASSKVDKRQRAKEEEKPTTAKRNESSSKEQKRVYDLLGNGIATSTSEIFRDSASEASEAKRFADNIKLQGSRATDRAPAIRIFVRSSGLPAPTIFIREEGGESQSTLDAVREHLEKELCATLLRDDWKGRLGGEYRFEGKKISVKRGVLGLGISTYDMPLRKKLFEDLSLKLNAQHLES